MTTKYGVKDNNEVTITEALKYGVMQCKLCLFLGPPMTYKIYIKLYKNRLTAKALAGDCVRVVYQKSNVGRKIVKRVEIRFYWLYQLLSHKCCQRDTKHVENTIM
jgi:hypothetical protein